MHRIPIIDTFPEFERYWESARAKPVDVQIDLWEQEYMAPWPELREKQFANYAQEGVDWKRVARTRIFPHIPERLSRMRRIHRELLKTLPGHLSKTRQILKLDFPIQFVIYVGIGCGAGWATRYGGRPACLFGLENAAGLATGHGRGIPGSVPHEVLIWRTKSGDASAGCPVSRKSRARTGNSTQKDSRQSASDKPSNLRSFGAEQGIRLGSLGA